MNSSPSITKLALTLSKLEVLQRAAYGQLSCPVPIDQTKEFIDPLDGYFATNPDVSPEAIVSATSDLKKNEIPRHDVIDLSGPPSGSILNRRVAELKAIGSELGHSRRLAKICFG